MGPVQILTASSIGFAVFAISWTVVSTSNLEKTLATKLVEMTIDEFALVQRMAVLDEVLNGMYRVHRANILCLVSAILLVLAWLSLSGFHLRIAIMVRSLTGSISPLAHFLFIFS